MSLCAVAAFSLQQVLDVGGRWTVEALDQHFSDHGQALPKALRRANDRAWQSLSVALAGDSFLTQVQVFFASGDTKGVAQQIKVFLESDCFPGTPPDFRKRCLDELKRARKEGWLSGEKLGVNEISKAARFEKYTDPNSLIDEAHRAVEQVADQLMEMCPRLAKLLRKRTADAPLLVVAFSFFFGREIETSADLSRRLTHDSLKRLHASQAKAFEQIHDALHGLGDQFDRVLEQLDRIEATVEQTQGAVLDLRGLLESMGDRQSAADDEMRMLVRAVSDKLDRVNMDKGEVRPQHSFSIHSDDERRAVKELLARFRQLSAEQQKQLPAVLNGLGKLQVGIGDFAGAEQTFEQVAQTVEDAAAQAEAHYNAYRATLEEKQWGRALAELVRAAELDARRFSPFPTNRYEPRQLLGAGGFGSAILCHDNNFDEDVVIKTLHADIERSLPDVFREARVLRRLNHPAIINVQECNFADADIHARPYIVMEYFPGVTLDAFVSEHGRLPAEHLIAVARQIADGMRAAHSQGVLHRDLKPANILVRKSGEQWGVKIIDFGLALRRSTVETSVAVQSRSETVLSSSVAGTLKYAPPEQKGELAAKPGNYSDVYSFGKLCCFALFNTTEPRRRHLTTIPEELADLLESCMEEELDLRCQSFDKVLEVLERLQSGNAALSQQAPQPSQSQSHTIVSASQPAVVAQVMDDKHAELGEFVWAALNRGMGGLSPNDYHEIGRLITSNGLVPGQAEKTIADLQEQWQKEHGHSQFQPASADLLAFPLAAEQAKDYQKRWADSLNVAVEVTNSIGMKFTFIPPGMFVMGSPAEETSRKSDETQFSVKLTKGFYMAVTPTTQAECERVTGKNPSRFRGADRPVENVSWRDCLSICETLSIDGKPYRLPTEAEWEYACRAGTQTAFCSGDDQTSLGTVGFYSVNSGGQTHKVAELQPNAWGLHDMHGNVLEWCADWYGPYPNAPMTDYRGPDSGKHRVLRGGSWGVNAGSCRSATRDSARPRSQTNFDYGCRLVFDLDL